MLALIDERFALVHGNHNAKLISNNHSGDPSVNGRFELYNRPHYRSLIWKMCRTYVYVSPHHLQT